MVKWLAFYITLPGKSIAAITTGAVILRKGQHEILRGGG